MIGIHSIGLLVDVVTTLMVTDGYILCLYFVYTYIHVQNMHLNSSPYSLDVYCCASNSTHIFLVWFSKINLISYRYYLKCITYNKAMLYIITYHLTLFRASPQKCWKTYSSCTSILDKNIKNIKMKCHKLKLWILIKWTDTLGGTLIITIVI